jgi:hypothetical protein
MPKKPAKKKAVKMKKSAPKKAMKKPTAPKQIITDSNGDPIGAKVLNHAPEKSPKGTEIDTSKGGVSIKAKKTSAEAKNPEEKKRYSVVMRGGVPTKVEDDGDEL